MNAAPTVASLDWVALAGNFVLVIVLLVALLWLLRRMQGIKGLQGLRPVARRLSVVEVLTVGSRQKLALLRLDDREILVGIAPDGFTLFDGVTPGTSAASASAGSTLGSGVTATGTREHLL